MASKVMAEVSEAEGGDADEKHPTVAALQHARVLTLKLLKALDELKEGVKSDEKKLAWQQPFAEQHDVVNKRITTEVTWWTSKYEKELEVACGKTTSLLSPAKAWNLQASACKTYASVSKLAKETLLKVEAAALETARSNMQEVFDQKG
eukprot:6461444-Amphidinium_carterae.1